MEGDGLNDFRCPGCGRLLARVSSPLGGTVQVKCPRCGHMSQTPERPVLTGDAAQKVKGALHR